ncbi:MAG: hypothetical protein ACERKD_22430 [Prolixibacteraceae bacterium]
MKYTNLFLLFVICMPFLAKAQSNDAQWSKKELRKQRPTYLELSSGLNYSSFRDFATSPLFYNGAGLDFSLAGVSFDSHFESVSGFRMVGGLYLASVQQNFTSSLGASFYAYYSRLYKVESLSGERFNFKTGGRIDLATNVRSNGSLGNNGFGLELIPTLFGSVKTTFDVSRKTAIDKHLWFIKCHREVRKRSLSYQLNLGIVNTSYRNGYIYNNQSFLLNDEKTFAGYVFSAFSGFRMNSSLDYTIYLKNCNAVRFTYLWEAYQTGGELDKFELASHSFKFALLFNTK